MDNNLLLSLFKIPAKTQHEENISYFIQGFLNENGVHFNVDDTGNIYNISKPKIPLLSAHMDTMQDDVDASLTKFIKIRNQWLNGYGVIGGDDKCGLYIILELLRSGEEINFILSTGEESGGTGIRNFVKKQDFSKLPYALVLDRRGADDIICSVNEYGTKEFENQLLAIGKVFDFSANTGTFSDADFISYQVSCANLSVGYYNPHSKNEFVCVDDVSNTLGFVHHIIKNLKTSFPPPNKRNRTFSLFDDDFTKDISFDGFFNGDYELCEFCGEITDKYIKLTSISKLACEGCYSKLEREIISKMECDDLRDLKMDTLLSE